jgi:hypothetical protein
MKLSVALVAPSFAQASLSFLKADAGVGLGMQQLAKQRLKAGNIFLHVFTSLRRISGRLAVCLSGRIPEFLAWPLSVFALQNECNLGKTP